MACMLRASGRGIDVDEYLRRSSLQASEVFHRGDVQHPTWPKARKSGCDFVVSGCKRTDLAGQVREASKWLRRKRRSVGVLRRFRGVENLVLDFGVEWHSDAAAQWMRLSEDLVGLAGGLGLALEMTMYPAAAKHRPHAAKGRGSSGRRRTSG